MRILYGVVGEGMGHATRSRVVLEHLHAQGHEIVVVASQRAYKWLSERFADRPRMHFQEIHGLHLDYANNVLEVGKSIVTNLGVAPAGVARNIAAYLELQRELPRPEVVISDFESWAFFYGLNHYLPVISIDNMQIINRCTHPSEVARAPSFQLAKAAVKVKLPGAYHYLVTTFFFPPVRKERTTLVPPILRPEVLAARREPGEHVLVYQTSASNELLLPMLQSLPGRFRVYGMKREGSAGNVEFRPFSETGFIDDLRTARAVLAGGGFSLMSEAVHLGVPMYAVPIAGQYEQELNARYLESLGYGTWSEAFDADRIADFLAHLPTSTDYRPESNQRTFDALDGLLTQIASG